MINRHTRSSELQPLPMEALKSWFKRNRIQFTDAGSLPLGFGHDQEQYQFYDYPAPGQHEAFGLFFEWETADFFDSPYSPHLAAGLWGPRRDDPHRGRGLAIGFFAAFSLDKDGNQVPQFSGAPPHPGGPAMFIEDFTVNDGNEEIADWQLTECRLLPDLAGNRRYRIHLLLSDSDVRAFLWEVLADNTCRFIDQISCTDDPPQTGLPQPYCGVYESDRGVGNVFVGHGFARPDNNSRIESLCIAHGAKLCCESGTVPASQK